MESWTTAGRGAGELASVTDWYAVGLVLAGVGACLIAAAVLARGRRGLASELLGSRGLVRLREALFQRALLVVGFAWLAAGFALQLLGHLEPANTPAFPVAWAGAILVATVLLLVAAWAWARHAARAAVREHLARLPRELGADMVFARDLGELFGVESRPEDSVESYLERLTTTLALPPAPRAARTPPSAFDGFDED